jgi:hypothetical protein
MSSFLLALQAIFWMQRLELLSLFKSRIGNNGLLNTSQPSQPE